MVPLEQYPTLAVTGIVSFFGSVSVAIPFLLDLLRIPADMFQLFLATGVVNQRFGALVAAMHTVVLALLGTSAIAGSLRINPSKLLRYGVTTAVLTVATIGGSRLLLAAVVENEYEKDDVIAGMQLLREAGPATVHREPPTERLPLAGPGVSRLNQIQERGYLRVGYWASSLPYAYFNAAGDLVGLDVEMAHQLADALDVGLEFVPVEPLDRENLEQQLDGSYCDIVMSGIAVTTDRAQAFLFSEPYLDETIAFIVKDHRRSEFTSFATADRNESRLAIPPLLFLISTVQARLPRTRLQVVTSPTEFFEVEGEHLDGAVMTAERGSAWTLLYPQYSVVVPDSEALSVPLAYRSPGRTSGWRCSSTPGST